MCGITGSYDPTRSTSSEILSHNTNLMCEKIIHRGPDDLGIWTDAESGIALGFRRLAILDLSPTGHQPMFSADERYVIIFNGEIYNYSLIRNELAGHGHHFSGTSDTEILLASIRQWGLSIAVNKLNGMFAFALWDKKEHSLSLVRDRMGIKPLYYGFAGTTLLFGSELKSLRVHPDFDAEISRDALTMFLRSSYIPAPYTIYNGFFKLPPACIMRFYQDQALSQEQPAPFWSIKDTITQGLRYPFEGTQDEVIDSLEKKLSKSIAARMIADVPLGAFLSGGIDSSTVVALMQKQSTKPIHTFSIGFSEAGFDEATHARKVSKHLGTFHTEIYTTPEEARSIIPRLPTIYDEPFADPSQIPTFLVSELARKSVTVGLSGDGGDELFGGYNRYFWIENIWRYTSRVHPNIRKAFSNSFTLIRPQVWSLISKMLSTRVPNLMDKTQKMSDSIKSSSPEEIYLNLVSKWKNPADVVIGGKEPQTPISPTPFEDSCSFTVKMMSIDLITYLPDDILVKVDRASMANSLEVRAPFLDDHETVEFAWKLPLNMKIRNGKGKWILRQILNKYVPQEMYDRPKMGFGVPIDSWLRGPLRPWAENLLDENRLHQEGYFRPKEIRTKWQEHLSGTRNWQYEMWNVLMFQAWLEATKS